MLELKRRVVILGGGYAGVRVAWDLTQALRRGAALDVVLVNDSAYHLNTPLLYEVATAYLKSESTQSSERVRDSVCVPLEEIFSSRALTIKLGRVTSIVPAERLVVFRDTTSLSYDTLVVALGAEVATYGTPGVHEHAFSVKTLHESLELRHHIVRHFMLAKKAESESAARALLTFVIVGAGAAGVETAAELAGHIAHQCQVRGVAVDVPHIVLVEAGEEILRAAPPVLRQKTVRRLQELGIEVRVHNPITKVAAEHVELANGNRILTHTTIWTGGLAAPALFSAAGLPVAQWGIAAEDTLQVTGHPNIFVAGDCAVLPNYPEKIPATVPVAYTQGALVAANIVRQLRQEPLVSYRYETLGALIATGGKTAVAIFPNQRGWFGVMPWLVKQLLTLRYWSWYLSVGAALKFWWRSVILHTHND